MCAGICLHPCQLQLIGLLHIYLLCPFTCVQLTRTLLFSLVRIMCLFYFWSHTSERIRKEANLQSTDCNILPHSSFSHHRANDPRLEINIALTPDCTSCVAKTQQATTTSSPGTNDDNDDNGNGTAGAIGTKKRPIIDTTNSNVGDGSTEAASPDAKRQKQSVSFADQGDGLASTSAGNATGTSSLENRMDVKDILSSLRKALPNLIVSSNTNDDTILNEGYLQQPLGRVLSEYKRTVQANTPDEADEKGDGIEAEFVITLADGSDKTVADYHNKIQGMAMFFIETADNVDLSSNEGGGHWKCVYVYRRHKADKYSLVGYTTLFHFNSPFRKPKAGIVMRVCQAIVLPPYQRGGHGSMMLNEVYKIAEGRPLSIDESTKSGNDEIVEVNVEDPCPGFVALRNKVDFKRFQKSSNLGSLQNLSTDVDSNAFWSPLPEDLVASGAAELRVTPQQILIASEMSKLCALEAKIKGLRSSNEISTNEGTIEGMEKKYRLMVKKRLLKVHREELGAYGSKDDQKAKLGELFDDTLRQYRSLLKLN